MLKVDGADVVRIFRRNHKGIEKTLDTTGFRVEGWVNKPIITFTIL